MKKFFRAESLGFLAIWLLLILFGRSLLFQDPGTFWHLVVGQQILASHHFPSTDIYSFTFYGHPWLANQWLMEGLMAFIYGRFGFDGLLVMTTAALAGLYTWLLARLLRAGLSVPLAALVLALVLAASSHHFHVRPHILSILFLAFTYARLCDYEAGRLQLRGLFWLWPLFIIWTNSHGAVLGGLGTLGLTLGGWTLARLLRQDSPIKTTKDLVALGVLLLGCILTAFLNPYGAELPKIWFTIVDSPAVAQLIHEHASLFREFWKNWPITAMGLFYLACLLGTLPRRPRVTWLIPLVWLVLACSRIRNAPLFAVTAALALADFFPQVRWAGWLGNRGSVIFRAPPASPGPPRVGLKSLGVPGTVVLLTVMVSLVSLRLSGHGLTRLDPRHWPLELLPDLARYEQAQPAGAPIMNDMLFGGFLIFYTPRLRVFIDDRCELYGDEFLVNYYRAEPTFIDAWIKRSGAGVALTGPGSSLDIYFKNTAGWRLVRRTTAAALYRRDGS
jgi:hypothetical protein